MLRKLAVFLLLLLLLLPLLFCCQGLSPSPPQPLSLLRTGDWLRGKAEWFIYSPLGYSLSTALIGHLPVGRQLLSSSAQGWPGGPGDCGSPERVSDPA